MAWKLPSILKVTAAQCGTVICCNLFSKARFAGYSTTQAQHRQGTHRQSLDLRTEPAEVVWGRRIPGLSLCV